MANTSNKSNYKMRTHRQCDYLFKFQANKRINKSILLWKWLRNAFDAKDNAYETLVFAYSKESDVLVLANFITISNVEEESSPPYLEDAVTNWEEETTNMENTTSVITLQSTMVSIELKDPPMEPDLTQYVKKRVWWHI
jgi:hypothetical protein